MDKKLKFEDETIWLDGEIIGGYSYKDKNSSFRPTKQKVWWGYIREHDCQSEDFIFYATNIHALKSRIAKYLENKKNGVKDLPQINEQLTRIIKDAHKYAGEKYGYYTKKCQEYLEKFYNRLNLIEEFKKRGYWTTNDQIIERKFYDLFI